MKFSWILFGLIKMACISALPTTVSWEQIDALRSGSEIYLVRHGESLFNVHKVNGVLLTSGKSEKIPLTEKGQQQAVELGMQLAKKIPTGTEIVICSSTALRAQKTADLMLQVLSPYFQCERGKSYEGLLELGQGIYEGLPKNAAYISEVNKWKKLSAAEKIITPKVQTGESFSQVSQRALSALQDIIHEHKGKMIFVVTHNAAMVSLTYHWYGYNNSKLSQEPGTQLPSLEFKNCDLLKVTFEDPAQLLHIKFTE